jgi:transcription antitermination factor NusG
MYSLVACFVQLTARFGDYLPLRRLLVRFSLSLINSAYLAIVVASAFLVIPLRACLSGLVPKAAKSFGRSHAPNRFESWKTPVKNRKDLWDLFARSKSCSLRVAMASLEVPHLASTPGPAPLISPCSIAANKPMWYAVYTMPQSERSLARHLDLRQIESFFPTYEETRVWKNRQRVKLALPLFPSYLFVRMFERERLKVLQSPGAVQILGSINGPISIPDQEIDFLRSDFCKRRVEPYRELVVGKTVRIKYGPMQGVCGVLVQKRNNLKFVLTLGLINQHAAIEVAAEELEIVPD